MNTINKHNLEELIRRFADDTAFIYKYLVLQKRSNEKIKIDINNYSNVS